MRVNLSILYSPFSRFDRAWLREPYNKRQGIETSDELNEFEKKVLLGIHDRPAYVVKPTEIDLEWIEEQYRKGNM